MSFFNPDVSKSVCENCWHKNKPYMSKYGAYTPCIMCENGSNRETNKANNPKRLREKLK